MINDLMTIEEICSHLGIGKNSAYKLAKTMRSVKIGRKLMVPRADVDKYISGLLNEKQNNQAP